MKTNAVLRIIIWSLVIVLLIGILSTGLLLRNRRWTAESPVETVVPTRIEAPAMPVETEYLNTKAIVTATAVNVRSGPSSSSSIVGYVEKDDTVLIGRGEKVDGEEWIWISSPTTGWLKAEYVEASESIPFIDSGGSVPSVQQDSGELLLTATVTEPLNIRSAPNQDSTALGLLQPGETVTIGRQETISGEAWAYISQPSAGWVIAKYLQTEDTASSDTASSGDISLDAKQIREIDIEWAAGNITIQPADVDGIQISESEPSDPKYTMVWKQNNDTLTIRFSENIGLDFNFGITINDVISKDLTILVPMGWECDSLEVAAASATLDVKNMVINEVDFDGASGTCDFENCVIDELDLDTASGDIHFTGSLNIMDCDAASASVIAVFDNVPSRISMDSMSGDLDITLPSTAGFTVTMDGLSTDFVSDFGFSQNRDGSYYRGNGQCKVTMDAMSGDVYIREYKAAEAISETTAAAEVPDTSSTHHHTDTCTTNPDSCPDNNIHHAEPAQN